MDFQEIWRKFKSGTKVFWQKFRSGTKTFDLHSIQIQTQCITNLLSNAWVFRRIHTWEYSSMGSQGKADRKIQNRALFCDMLTLERDYPLNCITFNGYLRKKSWEYSSMGSQGKADFFLKYPLKVIQLSG
jgi:hypothetical protein